MLEHHVGGRYSMKATSPDYGEKDHVAAGATVGGLTALCLGAIAGPLRLIFMAEPSTTEELISAAAVAS